MVYMGSGPVWEKLTRRLPVLNPRPKGSVATVQTGVFANLSNKIAIIIGKFENVDEAKNRGVFCQH
jgi:hypothetical protein